MKKIKLKLNNKTKIIFSILVIGIIVPTFIVCAFYKPTKLNKYIASTLYKEENNIYFNDNTLYNCIIDAYNKENNTTNPYTYSLSLEELSSIKEVTCRGDELSEEAFKVSDLTGIDKLENLEYLEIPNNFLTEVDLSKNRISNVSPIGAALIGAKKGETVEANTPGGIAKYKVLAIKK